MKLNATVEMQPVTWPETCNMHPFAPADQTTGYKEMIDSLNRDLAEITGFAAVSAQPNSGAQVRSDEISLDQIRLDEIRLDAIRLDEIRLDQVRSDEISLDQIRSDQMRSV